MTQPGDPPAGRPGSRVLFVSYDGVLAGPGRSQTLPYMRGLIARGHELALVTYEHPDLLADGDRVLSVRRELGDIAWASIPRHGRRLRDLTRGLRAVRAAWAEHRADFVHARGYVPAFLARCLSVPFLFDMRGFWPDERVDGGLWTKRSAGYRLWKRIERILCRRAAAVVVMTTRARDELARLGLTPGDKAVHVIPACADLERFRPVAQADRPPECADPGPRFLILGGTGTWYLRDEMLDLAARALERDSRARLHVLTEDAPGPLVEGLERRGVPASRRLVRAVPAADVPRWISGAAAGIALIRSTWSKGASCPTKLGELLGCGVPLLMNAGIGDVDRILEKEGVGVTVRGFDGAAYDAALDALAELASGGRDALSQRCRDVARREFSLQGALERYDIAYADARAAVR